VAFFVVVVVVVVVVALAGREAVGDGVVPTVRATVGSAAVVGVVGVGAVVLDAALVLGCAAAKPIASPIAPAVPSTAVPAVRTVTRVRSASR
jgi:hypothetical protein